MRARTLAAFATIYLVWGSTYLAIAYAVTSIPPLLMMGVRSLLAGGILYVWARVDGVEAPRPAAWLPAALAGALMFLVGHGTLAWAEQRVAFGVAALVLATGTFWMIGVEWMRRGGRRPTVATLFGALLGLAGVGVLVGGPGGGLDPAGAIVLTVSAASWAAGSVYARDCGLPSSPRMATAMPLLAGGAMLIATSAATGEMRAFDVGAVDARALLSLLYLVVFGSVIAFTAYIWLLRVSSAVQVSTHNFVNPVVAVVLGWAFAGEVVSARVLIAGAVIVASIIVIRRARADSGTPTTAGSDEPVGQRAGTRVRQTRPRSRSPHSGRATV